MAYSLIDPDEKKNFSYDWDTVLASTVTISASTWFTVPLSTKGPNYSLLSISSQVTTVYIDSMPTGIYELKNRIRTSINTIEEQTVITLRCR